MKFLKWVEKKIDIYLGECGYQNRQESRRIIVEGGLREWKSGDYGDLVEIIPRIV